MPSNLYDVVQAGLQEGYHPDDIVNALGEKGYKPEDVIPLLHANQQSLAPQHQGVDAEMQSTSHDPHNPALNDSLLGLFGAAAGVRGPEGGGPNLAQPLGRGAKAIFNKPQDAIQFIRDHPGGSMVKGLLDALLSKPAPPKSTGVPVGGAPVGMNGWDLFTPPQAAQPQAPQMGNSGWEGPPPPAQQPPFNTGVSVGAAPLGNSGESPFSAPAAAKPQLAPKTPQTGGAAMGNTGWNPFQQISSTDDAVQKALNLTPDTGTTDQPAHDTAQKIIAQREMKNGDLARQFVKQEKMTPDQIEQMFKDEPDKLKVLAKKYGYSSGVSKEGLPYLLKYMKALQK